MELFSIKLRGLICVYMEIISLNYGRGPYIEAITNYGPVVIKLDAMICLYTKLINVEWRVCLVLRNIKSCA